MASLDKRPGGTYSLVWTDTARRPHQVRESLKTDDRKKALLKKKELEWKYSNHQHDPWKRKWYERERPEEMPLGEAIERYIKYKRNAKGKRGWSWRRYKSVAPSLRHFGRMTGDIPVSAVSEKHLEAFFYRPGVNSSHTRRTYRINLITFFKWCQRKGFLDGYPDHELKPTKQKVPKFIYPDQLAELIQWKLHQVTASVKEGQPHGTHESFCQAWMVYGWMMLASTGMRPSEVMRIKWQHVGRAFIDIGEDFDVKNAVERRIPLLYEAPQALFGLRLIRDKDRMMADSPYLLGRPSDGSAKRLSKEFRRGWDALFQSHRVLYNLKDFFAVRFLTGSDHGSKDHRLYELQQILGHKTITSTEKYLKAIPYGVSLEGTIWDTASDYLTDYYQW